MADDPGQPPFGGNQFFDPTLAIWPDLANGKVALSPVRVGMDRRTGKMLVGWPHVVQSIQVIFATRYHERVLRRWVGSFVPHMLGESAVARVITRFFWAIAMALDLWEPDYRIQQVWPLAGQSGAAQPVTDATTAGVAADDLRKGNITFAMQGVYRPRAHLGDLTPETTRTAGFVGRGNDIWDPLS